MRLGSLRIKKHKAGPFGAYMAKHAARLRVRACWQSRSRSAARNWPFCVLCGLRNRPNQLATRPRHRPRLYRPHLRAKFSSSGVLFAKQRKRVTGRSQGPSRHPASSRDEDGAQNATVLACCGLLREARTRVRARAACKVCICVQYRTREKAERTF